MSQQQPPPPTLHANSLSDVVFVSCDVRAFVPVKRNTRTYAHNSDENYEVSAFPFNSGSAEGVKERSIADVDPAVLAEAGRGEAYPLYFMERAENGNFLETNEINKRARPCGDPDPQVRAVRRRRKSLTRVCDDLVNY